MWRLGEGCQKMSKFAGRHLWTTLNWFLLIGDCLIFLLINKQAKALWTFWQRIDVHLQKSYSNNFKTWKPRVKCWWNWHQVEPNPDAFSSLKTKQRKSNLFGHCLSTKRTPEVVEFDACGLIGGIIHNGQKPTDEEMYKPYQVRRRSYFYLVWEWARS